GEIRDIALEREHALAGVSCVDGGDAEVEIEIRVAELVRVSLADRVGLRGLALVEQCLQLICRRSVRCKWYGRRERGGGKPVANLSLSPVGARNYVTRRGNLSTSHFPDLLTGQGGFSAGNGGSTSGWRTRRRRLRCPFSSTDRQSPS